MRRNAKISLNIGRSAFLAEILPLGEDIKPTKPAQEEYALVEELYRYLKLNYEDEGDLKSSGDFHYGEMEMHRRGSPWRQWLPSWYNFTGCSAAMASGRCGPLSGCCSSSRPGRSWCGGWGSARPVLKPRSIMGTPYSLYWKRQLCSARLGRKA